MNFSNKLFNCHHLYTQDYPRHLIFLFLPFAIDLIKCALSPWKCSGSNEALMCFIFAVCRWSRYTVVAPRARLVVDRHSLWLRGGKCDFKTQSTHTVDIAGYTISSIKPSNSLWFTIKYNKLCVMSPANGKLNVFNAVWRERFSLGIDEKPIITITIAMLAMPDDVWRCLAMPLFDPRHYNSQLYSIYTIIFNRLLSLLCKVILRDSSASALAVRHIRITATSQVIVIWL